MSKLENPRDIADPELLAEFDRRHDDIDAAGDAARAAYVTKRVIASTPGIVYALIEAGERPSVARAMVREAVRALDERIANGERRLLRRQLRRLGEQG